DNLPYQTSVDGATLTLRGAENGALGLRVTKTVSPSASASSPAMSIQYVVENDGAASRSVAPWEITRVRPEGLIFFPTGAGAAFSADAGPPLPTRQAAGATWFDVATLPAGNASIKYFADGARGWVAHLRGGMLFVKKFADIAPSDAAPGEAEIEVYVNGDRAYIELEV
ncbi:MAG: hypothetical protein JOZ69_06435, partial [Myxococcales bacterium]|nr:hypothetical protein [Myxococcales bacterium]